MSFNTNDLPRFGTPRKPTPRGGYVGIKVNAAQIMEEFFPKFCVEVAPAPKLAPMPKPAPAYAPAPTPVLRIGMKVRGADVVPSDYETVNRNFRGTILDFSVHGKNNVRVRMDGTKRVFRVEQKYLVPLGY